MYFLRYRKSGSEMYLSYHKSSFESHPRYIEILVSSISTNLIGISMPLELSGGGRLSG